MRKVIFLILTGISITLNAQLIDFDNKAIEKDFKYNLNLYSQQYAGAVIEAYGVNQATAWQYSGEVLKPYGFSISLQSAATFLKKEDQTFNYNQHPFSDKLRLENPKSPTLPTLIGGETNKDLIYKVEGKLNTPVGGNVTYEKEFSALNGVETPYNSLPKTALMVSMGLPMDFEASVRYFPKVTILDVDHYEYGFGVKHKISRYFIEKDKPFKISASAFYNFSKFSYEPADLFAGENQLVLLSDQTINGELTASFEKKYYSVFVLLSYYSTNTNFNIDGTYRYKVEEKDQFGNTVVQEAFSVTNPVALKSQQGLWRTAIGASAKYKEAVVVALAYNFSVYHSLSLNLVFKINNGG